MTYLLIAVILIDLAMLGMLFYSNQQKGRYLDIIKELHDERQLFNELKQDTRADLEQLKHEGKSFYDRVSALATEAEMEIKSGRDNLRTSLQALVGELTPQLEKPLTEIGKKQAILEKCMRKADQQRELLIKAIARSEDVLKLLNKEVPYEKIVDELKDKKYENARQLISQGMSAVEVSRELNLSENEVRMIAGLSII